MERGETRTVKAERLTRDATITRVGDRYIACDHAGSRTFKTESGAERWLLRRAGVSR